VWTIIKFSPRILDGGRWMVLKRRLHPLIFGCVFFCLVVSATSGNIPAQSRQMKKSSSRGGATKRNFAKTPDVARFRARMEAELAAPGPNKGYLGILVTDAGTGEVLFARNADGYFMPASDTKLFTTALALATLGPDYRVKTTVVRESIGRIRRCRRRSRR
jgi:D-alanyl-D-alanine carboxypeptidase